MRKVIITLWLLVSIAVGVSAREYTITVNEPGTLKEELDKVWTSGSVSKLIVVGAINHDDLDIIPKLLLESLDLSRASVVERSIPSRLFFDYRYQYEVVYKSFLKEVILPEGLEEIEERAFEDNPYLEKVVLPSTLKNIGDLAFADCIRLKGINIPEGVEKIAPGCFKNCKLLKSIVLPSSVKRICREAFYQSGLNTISLPNGLLDIEEGAFAKSRLQSIEIPESCMYIRDGAFEGDSILTSVSLPGSISNIKMDCFRSCTALESIEIPEGVAYIEASAFEDCTNLKDLKLPNSLICMHEKAFYNNAIEVLHVPCVNPGKFKLAGVKALYGRVPLKKIYAYGTQPVIFAEVAACIEEFPLNVESLDIPVYVPVGTKEVYKQSPAWYLFTNLIESEDMTASGMANVAVENNVAEITVDGNELTISGAKCQYEVYNVEGKIVVQGQCDGNIVLAVAPGVYIVKAGSVIKKVVL